MSWLSSIKPVKALKFMLISLLGFILISATFLCWIVFTESGTRQLFSTLTRFELLSYQNLQGSISHQLTIETLRVHTPAAEINIHELSLTADWSELLYSKVQVQELSAQQIDINLLASAKDPSSNKPINFDFFDDRLVFIPLELLLQEITVHNLNISQNGQQYNLQDIQLTSLLNQQGVSNTRLSLRYKQTSLQLQGHLAMAPRLAIDMQLNWNSMLPDLGTLSGAAQLSGDSRELSLHHSMTGNLASDVQIRLSNWREAPLINLQGSVDKLTWPLNNSGPPQLTDILISANGEPSALQVNAQARMSLNEQRHNKLELIALVNKDKLDISKLRITDNRDGSAEISGQLSWLNNTPQWQAQALLSQFDGSSLHPLIPQKLQGSLSLDGHFDKSLALNIVSKNLQGELRARPFEADINAQLEGDDLRVRSLQSRIGNNTLAVSGQLNQSSFNISFDSQLTDLKEIAPSLKGSIKASGTLTGSPKQPILHAQAEAEALQLFGFSAQQIKLSVNLNNGIFVKDSNYLAANNVRYQTIQLETLNITSQGHWQAPDLWLNTSSPDLQVNLQTSLQLAHPEQVDGQLKQLRLLGASFGDWQLEQPVNYRVDSQGWSLTALCLQNNGGQACVQASSGDDQFEAKLRGQQIPLSLLNATGLLSTKISGNLDIDANLAGDLKQNQGQLHISQGKAGTPIVLTAADGTTQIRIDGLNSKSTLTNGLLNGNLNAQLNDDGLLNSEFEVSQLLAAHSPLKAQFDYKIPDLKPYALLIPEVDALEGTLEGTVKLSNSLQQPKLWLFTRLQVPHIYISPLAIEWHNLTAEITTPSSSMQAVKATVEAGDGHLALDGTLAFISPKEWCAEMSLTGKKALLMDQPNRRVIASPDMKITATENNLQVSGILRIPEAMLNIKPSPNRLSLTPDAIIHRDEAANPENHTPFNVNLDLAVLLADKVNFQAYGLNTNVTGKLQLTKQPPGALLGHGELNLVDGAYQAYGQDLTIDRGIISFSGILSRPNIMLTASRTIKSVKAGLHVNGPVDNLRTQLFSEPPLQDSEILSYIIRGKPLSDTNTADQNVLANALLSYSISQSTPVTSKLTELSGLDEIGIEAEEGVETLGFTLGKYITPRLYARYGLGIIDKLSKVFLQYQLTDKLYLETEAGIGQSVDLIYRSR